MPIIIGPPSLGHTYVDKCVKLEQITCVGRSPHFDPDQDFMDEKTDKNLRIRSAGQEFKIFEIEKKIFAFQ